jgi:uncharacterized membrane protein YjdF
MLQFYYLEQIFVDVPATYTVGKVPFEYVRKLVISFNEKKVFAIQ